MNTATTYKYGLDRSSKKFTCPQCGHRRFVRCMDLETKDYLPPHVGRCDRQHDCSYNYTWNQYLKEVGDTNKPFIEMKTEEPARPVDYIPLEYLRKAVRHYECNNLFLYLCSVFGEKVTLKLCQRYLIGTSKYWRGATLYPQLDEEGRFRQCKIMLYNPTTGKRVKEGATVERYDKKAGRYNTVITEDPCSKIYGKYISDSTRELNLEQTFFGHHLLTENPGANVAIVESEKTALIASVYLPEFVFLATGGASGCRWKEYSVYSALKDREVVFFPDYGYFNKKTGKTCYQEWSERVGRISEVLPGKFKVSDLLERRLANLERQDQDLADLLTQYDEQSRTDLTNNVNSEAWNYDSI